METRQNLSLPQGLDASKDGSAGTTSTSVIRIQTPTKALDPNHDARFQYCLLFSFVLMVLVMCIFGDKLGSAQVGLVGGGIGTIAGLLKQTQYLSKRSSDDSK
jgi:hypothetical protein